LRRTPERERASALGVLTAFYDLFVGISSLLAGAIANRFGYAAAFLMAAGAIAAAAGSGRYVFPAWGRDAAFQVPETVAATSEAER